MAFLSACTTANAGARLPDEAIHLASALQLAGFREVIRTLWPIPDQLAVQVAETFYQQLGATGRIARALHITLRELRHKYGTQVCGAYMHYGTGTG